VRTLAGEGSPVIVVQSQCDRFADRRPGPQAAEGFWFFESCSYSAKEDLGREALEAHLRDAIRSILEKNGALEIGRGRAEVRRQLYEWRSKDQEHQPEERSHRTFTKEEFRTLCDKVGGILSWEHALDYLHLEAHLDDGFQAVREALRRRIEADAHGCHPPPVLPPSPDALPPRGEGPDR